jgi:hypothetical protein
LLIPLILSACTSKIEIPFTLTDQNRIVIEANVNGTVGRYFWDTGCFNSQVNCKTDNLKVAYGGSLSQLGTSDNLTYYTLNDITINGIKIKATSEVSKIPFSLQNTILTPEGLDGLLGINIFEGYYCELDFSHRKIILTKKKPLGFSKSIKTELENNYLLVKIKINGVITRFYIDTGDPYSIKLPESIVYEKGIAGVKKVAIERNNVISLVPVTQMTVFDSKFENVFVYANSQYFQTTLSGGTGIIGTNFLKNYNMVFDFRNLRLLKTTDIFYSLNNTKQVFLDILPKIPETGIVYGYKNSEGLHLQRILKESLLYAKGIEPNTIITEINSIKIENYSLEDLYGMLDSMKSINTITCINDSKIKTVKFY